MIFKYKKYKFNIPDKNLNAKSNKRPESIGERMEKGLWEKNEVLLLDHYLEPSDKVIELGACIGFLGVLVNDRILNKNSHVLIEANPELIPILNENKILNNSKFKIEHCIIGDSTKGSADFKISEFILGSSMYGKGSNSVKVPIKSLSEYSNKYNFLIVDIEGGEYELIKNYPNEIKKFNKILIEFHPFFGYTENDVKNGINLLTKLGFKIADKKGHVFMLIKNNNK